MKVLMQASFESTEYTAGDETLIFPRVPYGSMIARRSGREVEGTEASEMLVRMLAATNTFIPLLA